MPSSGGQDRGSSDVERVGLIAGRYRVQSRIGRGGMARVYRVLDERTNTQLALKLLVVRDGRVELLRAMFENEYHMLHQLVHPAIVRVHDFGAHGDDVFYTMELLQGRDLHKASSPMPMAVPEVCGILRDVASALALIHSRRLVHRDVSPHNVWRTPDGRAKLIDFGTLVAMSPQRRVVGTPPFVPPEAMHGQPLDGRTDLYALGALGYYLLAGKNAYRARTLAQLRNLWKRPAEPVDALRPDLPRPLTDLVTGLLSLDPRGRPSSAAEVVDRLTAIADLPPEDTHPVAQAYLTTPTLVGRAEISGRMRRLLARASRGRGAALALTAATGLGRTRMLASLGVEAKLMGASVVVLDVDAVEPGRRQVATALSHALAEATRRPVASPRTLAEDGLDVEQRVHPSDPPASSQTVRLGADLVAAVELAARDQLTLVAIDDVHRADDSSLAVLARLATVAPSGGFVLATTCDADALAVGSPMLQQLTDASIALELPPLTADDTRSLLTSVFGEPERLDEAADWLHELAQGNPDATLHYAQYLVDRGLARYADGKWSITARLRDHGLPDNMEAMLTMRLRGLSDDARALALGLALTFDDTRPIWQPETHVRIPDYPKLLAGDSARAFTAIGELLRVGVLEQRDERFVLAQRALVDVLRREAGPEACRHMHGRLARLFEEGGYRDVIMTLRQLQRGGEHGRAMRLLLERAEADASPAQYDWDQVRIALAHQAYLDALDHWQAHGGTPREGVLLRRHLLTVGSVYEWDVGDLGDVQMRQLRADCGLVGWDPGDPATSPLERLTQCLQAAQARYEATPKEARGLAPLEAVREMASATLLLAGAYSNSHDVDRLLALRNDAEALRPLTPVTELLADLNAITRRRATGRELGEDQRLATDRLASDETLPDILRSGAAYVLGHIQGVEDARRGRIAALETADRLAFASTVDRWTVWHLRWLGHCFRGEDARAEPMRAKVEGAAEDDVWRRKAFLFAEAQLHALTGDLLALRGTVDAIDVLAQRFAGWQPWADYGRAEIHRLLGELTQAEDLLEGVLAAAPAGRHRAWVVAAPAHAELVLERGDATAALAACDAMLEAVERHGLDVTAAIGALRVRALALSAEGNAEAASEALEQAFVRARAIGLDGLPMVPLREAEARFALTASDAQAYTRALGAIERLLQEAEAPALHRRCDALRRQGHGLVERALSASLQPSQLPTSAPPHFNELSTRLTSISDSRERSEHVLHTLLEETGAASGHLFLVDEGGLLVAASVAEGYPSAGLVAAVQQRLQQLKRADAVTSSGPPRSDSAESTPVALRADGEARFLPVTLVGGDASDIIGIAALGGDPGRLPREPRPDLVAAIGRGLGGWARPVDSTELG